jgi:perosamine synthetase
MEFIHDEVGYNYRLTNLAAALGCAQLERIEAHLEAKRRIAARYDEAFAGIAGLHPHREAPWARSSHWLYTVQVDPAAFPVDRAALQRALADAGIQTRPLWQPIHLSPAYPGVEVLGGEVSEALYARCLSLPCSVGLSSEQQERVITAVTAVARGG